MEKRQKQNSKHTEHYRVLLVPGGKTEQMATSHSVGATYYPFQLYKIQGNLIPHRRVLGLKLTGGIHSHTDEPEKVFPGTLPVPGLIPSTGSYRSGPLIG